MNWIFIGLLLGSTITSSHDSREACEGRAVMLKEKGVNGQCFNLSNNSLNISGTLIPLWGNVR